MSCSLCGSANTATPIIDASFTFCCHGCHAVFQILRAKDALNNFQEHPTFIQAVRAGLISNPDVLAQLQEKEAAQQPGITQKWYMEIGDMWCPSCAELIRLVLLKEKGVDACVVEYATDLAAISYNPMETSKEEIKKRIASLGYSIQMLEAPEKQQVSHALYLRFIIAAFCSLNVMMFAYPLYASYFSFDEQGYGELFAWLSLLVSIPVVTYCAWPIYVRAWNGAFVGIFGMEALVAIGVGAACIFSVCELLAGGTQVYFDSMTVVVVFVLLGRIIESRAKFSAKSTLIRLHKAIPKKGRKKMGDGIWQYVPVKDIAVGDCVQVLMGEKIVLDGIVTAGAGTCDESLMTGESMPVNKREGAQVLAGALLQNGYLEVEVTGAAESTTLHRILQLVETDLSHKSTYARAVDPLVKTFVPLVLALAAAVFVWCLPLGFEPAFKRMMAVLLISCPCAIGIAAPLAESHLMHALANLGVVIKNRGVLRYLGEETVYVFDKTGTITEGHFRVKKGFEMLSTLEKAILKSMTARSLHPIATAVSLHIAQEGVSMQACEEIAGRGIKARYADQPYFLGSRQFLSHYGIEAPKNASVETHVFFADKDKVLATLVLGDQVRADAVETIRRLSPTHTILLSGDAQPVVERVAMQCGFTEHYAEASPMHKREVIEQQKASGAVVCMLGDGINDAPALTAAHVGISVLAAADISVQISDILLTTDKLETLIEVRMLAQKARRIIKQNLFWAFAYNIIGVGLAAAGMLSPIFAAVAMVLSSLIVLVNAQRLSQKQGVGVADP